MKKLLLSIGFILIAFCVNAQQTKFTADQLYLLGLRGDVKTIIEKIKISQPLAKNDSIVKEKYLKRFDLQNEQFDYQTKDTLLIGVLKIYQAYWKNALLKQVSMPTADSILAQQMTSYLQQVAYPNVTRDSISRNFVSLTKKILNGRGFGVANGKTAGYFDMLVWAKETTENYKVQLPLNKVNVKVVFMDDIVTMGWEEYATFGTYYPGGWSTSTELHCVKSTYQLDSEKFKVSYLAHEGQHFSDQNSFKYLEQTDLEYRAKLTELSFAKETLYNLISFFVSNSKNAKQNAHSFANYCLIRDLSKKLFNKEYESDLEAWKKLTVDQINNAAVKLLKEHTKLLKKQPKDVKSLIAQLAVTKVLVKWNLPINS